jgi:diaminopimelate decarboxylase
MTVPLQTRQGLSSSWLADVDLARIVQAVGTPVFVYSAEQLRRNLDRVQAAAAAAGLQDRVELYIPFFPNSNPHLLATCREAGAGILLQVPAEYKLLRTHGFEKFIVSPGHVSDDEIAFWADTGCPTFLSSLDEISYALQANAPLIGARIDSLNSGKPGVKLDELGRLAQLVADYDRDLDCFEVYCGSGNTCDDMIEVIKTLFSMFKKHFPHVQAVNFAGGHGFSYTEWEEDAKHFNWHTYLGALRQIMEDMKIPDHVRFMFEPARDMLADTGALVLSLKRSIISNPVANIVVTDGSRMLMPSAQLRDRRHNVTFLDGRMQEITADEGQWAAIRGRTILRHDYLLPGEYWVPDGVDAESFMAVFDVGVYCATQHMEFLNVPPAAEVLIDETGEANLVTARGDEFDKWRHLLPAKQPLPLSI